MFTLPTPAPWRGNGTNDGANNNGIGPDCRCIYGDGETPFVCRMDYPFADTCPEKPSTEQRIANARLIVAAPDLLEIAKQCLHMLSTDADLETVSRPDLYESLVHSLKLVIKKADPTHGPVMYWKPEDNQGSEVPA